MEAFLLMVMFFWFFFSVLVAVLAHKRGRFAFGWGIISVMLSPLIGGVIVMALPNAKKNIVKDGLGNQITEATHKRCTACKEFIRRDALKCRHCGEMFVEPASNMARPA